jgi:hypothetical protein
MNRSFPVDPEEYAGAAQHFLPMLPPETYPYMREMAEKVADGSHDGGWTSGSGWSSSSTAWSGCSAGRAPAEARLPQYGATSAS